MLKTVVFFFLDLFSCARPGLWRKSKFGSPAITWNELLTTKTGRITIGLYGENNKFYVPCIILLVFPEIEEGHVSDRFIRGCAMDGNVLSANNCLMEDMNSDGEQTCYCEYNGCNQNHVFSSDLHNNVELFWTNRTRNKLLPVKTSVRLGEHFSRQYFDVFLLVFPDNGHYHVMHSFPKWRLFVLVKGPYPKQALTGQNKSKIRWTF